MNYYVASLMVCIFIFVGIVLIVEITKRSKKTIVYSLEVEPEDPKGIKDIEDTGWRERFDLAVYIEDPDVEKDVIEFIDKEREDLAQVIKDGAFPFEGYYPNTTDRVVVSLAKLEDAIENALKNRKNR